MVRPGPNMPLENAPPNLAGGTGFPAPETVVSPYQAQMVWDQGLYAEPSALSGGVLPVHNPSVIFQFPIAVETNAYFGEVGVQGEMNFYPSIGWKGMLALEACLTPQQAQSWPGAQNLGSDATCATVTDPATNQNLARNWYQVAQNNLDFYITQTKFFTGFKPTLPVNFQNITMPVRFHVVGDTYLYPDPHTGPNNSNATPQGDLDHQDMHTSVFTLTVLPAALIQLKVLPETIIYLPPGNQSFADLKVTSTFATTITAASVSELDNSTSNDDWMENIDQTGGTASTKIFNLGYSSSADTRWDTKTTIKTGQTLEHDAQGLNQQQVIITRKIQAGPLNVPGAAGVYANQPFWSDLIVVLVHPQFAFWDFYGRTTLQLMAASGAFGAPDDIAITVSDLDTCSRGVAPNAAGYQFLTASNATETLTASECKALASLDPFWGSGQSATLGARGQEWGAPQQYGTTSEGSVRSLDLQDITSQQETVTTQSTATYSATAEDIVASTQSAGMNIGETTAGTIPLISLGLSESVTLKQGSSTDTGVTMNLTYKNSSATSYRQDVQTEGVINDTVNRGYTPTVETYLDLVFGSFMFRDPNAPCNPMPRCEIMRNVAPIMGPARAVQ